MGAGVTGGGRSNGRADSAEQLKRWKRARVTQLDCVTAAVSGTVFGVDAHVLVGQIRGPERFLVITAG